MDEKIETDESPETVVANISDYTDDTPHEFN